MNKLRQALAVIENREGIHEVAIQGGLSLRVVCRCGWEGPFHTPFENDITNILLEEMEAHGGKDVTLWADFSG